MKTATKLLFEKSARLITTTATTAVICLMAGQAAHADDAKIKSFSLNTQAVYQFDQVNITSSSGERWDTIEPGTIKFRMTGRLDTKWPGEVVESGVFLGDCANQQCANYPILEPAWNHAGTRDWDIDETVSFSTSLIPIGSPNAVMLSDFGQKAIAACNSGSNNRPSVSKSFNYGMTISLSVNTQKNLTTSNFFGPASGDFGGGDTTQRSTFAVKVNCIPYASMVVGADPVEATLSIIKPITNVCPATGTAMTRLVYHYPKTATFDIKRNGKIIKTVEIKARKVSLSHGLDQWVIDRHDQVMVEGGENRFRVKVKGGGKSKLVRFNHNCPQFDVLFSDLRYDVVNIGSCPKKVYETASFITNGPGEATYQMVQESGHVFFEKKVQTIFNNGQYKLLGQRVLDMPQSFEGKFRAQIKGMSGINTNWETLKVECPQESDGEFSLDTSPQDDALDPVVASWNGKIIIADGNAPQGEYKRPAQVFFQVEREQSGNFDYHISCSNGRSFQGSATSFNSGGSKWKAFGTHNFNMTRPMMLQCRLREVKSNSKKVSIDKTSFRFVGTAVNPDLAGTAGDLASPDNDDDNGLPTPKPMTGSFTFVDNNNAAKQNKCERSSKALVWFDAPKNDNIHYSLDCGDLGNFSGVLQPASIGNNRYRAGKIINFQVKKTIQAGCTLRTVSPGVAKDHAFKSKTFQCVKSAGHSSGIDGITTPARPQTKTAPVRINPVKPKLKVAVCKGGKIKNGNCFCAKGKTRKKISRFEYLCKRDRIAKPSKPEKPKKPVRVNPPKPKKIKDPVRTNPKPKKKKKLVCVGGKIRGGKCSCGSNKLRKKIAKRKFQCAAIAKPPKPKKPVRVNPKPKKKALICKGGKVRGGKCRCPNGRLLKKQGKRKFLCFRPAG